MTRGYKEVRSHLLVTYKSTVTLFLKNFTLSKLPVKERSTRIFSIGLLIGRENPSFEMYSLVVF